MNQMVSIVGPMAHVGHGTHTGMGIEKGLGVVRQVHGLSEEVGPGFGRDMGMTRREGHERGNKSFSLCAEVG